MPRIVGSNAIHRSPILLRLLRAEEKKYRHIRLTNAAVQQRLLPGSVAFLEAAGWRRCDGDECLELPTTPEVSALLQTACELVDGALKNPFFGML